MEAVVLYRVPLALVSYCGVGLPTPVQVNDLGSGRVGETLQLFLIDCEKDVVNTLTIEVAGNQALTAESLKDGFVAFLANFAFKRKMLHCFVC